MVTSTEQASEVSLEGCRRAQVEWWERGLAARLRILRRARHALARMSSQLVDAMPVTLSRTRADSYVTEVLPLLAACRFLEKEARTILKTRRLGSKGRPLWLSGVDATVERVPLGMVLIIAPANYPLFLAGVQALHALAAGNAVVWKPGEGGEAVAKVFASALLDAGIPSGLLLVTDDSPFAGVAALMAHPDKVFFTGSVETGRKVLGIAASFAIPVVAELSGCDAVVVLPSADEDVVVDALVFGMRLNGSATCMAPRRLFLVGGGHESLLERLHRRFEALDGISISEETRHRVAALMQQAADDGAAICGDVTAARLKPVLVEDGDPRMKIAQSDIFAPVLTVLRAHDADAVVEMDKVCPFGLTSAIFGEEKAACALGSRLDVGTVVVNDLIVPTADPRVSFGGRRGSGFGVTRGAEGLLEMTAAKTVSVRRRRVVRQYQPTDDRHEGLFAGLVALSHGATMREKVQGLITLVASARKLR